MNIAFDVLFWLCTIITSNNFIIEKKKKIMDKSIEFARHIWQQKNSSKPNNNAQKTIKCENKIEMVNK